MRRGARIAANVLTLGLFGFVRRIVENRKAVHAGLPRPHHVGELVGDALEIGAKAALPAVRNERVREGIEIGMELLNEATPTERPKAKQHRGVR